MARFTTALVGASCALLSCGPVPANDKVDGWALTRAALTNGKECFAGRAEYCITDPDFVDAAIRPRLDDLYGGEMPMKRLKVEGTIRTVARNYRRLLMKPENLARVEELVKERYANPIITMSENEVALDMGVTPGHLEASSATLSLSLPVSNLAEDGLWAESEAERVLSEAATMHPEKSHVRVTVVVPSRKGLTKLVYRYSKEDGYVVVTDEDGGAWSSRKVEDVAALATLPLKREDLAQCSLSKQGSLGKQAHGLTACPLVSVD